MLYPPLPSSTSCKWRVDPEVAQCPNSSCPAPSSGQEPSYNILLSLSDHTDSLEGARLTGQPATDLLQHTVRSMGLGLD